MTRRLHFAATRLMIGLLAIGALDGCQRYATPTEARGGGQATPIELSSQHMTLPPETATLPASADIVATNCTGCHSPEMILTQPRLKPEQWAAEVTKMREAYKAPIAEADDAKIVAALVALQVGAAR